MSDPVTVTFVEVECPHGKKHIVVANDANVARVQECDGDGDHK